MPHARAGSSRRARPHRWNEEAIQPGGKAAETASLDKSVSKKKCGELRGRDLLTQLPLVPHHARCPRMHPGSSSSSLLLSSLEHPGSSPCGTPVLCQARLTYVDQAPSPLLPAFSCTEPSVRYSSFAVRHGEDEVIIGAKGSTIHLNPLARNVPASPLWQRPNQIEDVPCSFQAAEPRFSTLHRRNGWSSSLDLSHFAGCF